MKLYPIVNILSMWIQKQHNAVDFWVAKSRDCMRWSLANSLVNSGMKLCKNMYSTIIDVANVASLGSGMSTGLQKSNQREKEAATILR